jgi:hypothetical protein
MIVADGALSPAATKLRLLAELNFSYFSYGHSARLEKTHARLVKG